MTFFDNTLLFFEKAAGRPTSVRQSTTKGYVMDRISINQIMEHATAWSAVALIGLGFVHALSPALGSA